MSKIARIAVTAALAVAAAGGFIAPSASASSSHNYTCSNQGGGPNHTVNCSGLITVNNVLTGTTVDVHDINVLSNNQLNDLQVALVNVSNNDVNLLLNTQLLNLQNTVVKTYLNDFKINLAAANVTVCAGSICI